MEGLDDVLPDRVPMRTPIGFSEDDKAKEAEESKNSEHERTKKLDEYKYAQNNFT